MVGSNGWKKLRVLSKDVCSVKQKNSRELALSWLCEVIINGKSLNSVLGENNYKKNNDKTDKNDERETGLAKQITYGCLRFYHQLIEVQKVLVSKSLKEKDQDIQIIVLIGLYQLKHLKTADHAAISETVNLAKKIKKQWATGLVNGVLRNYQRTREEIEFKLNNNDLYKYSHPKWLIDTIKNNYPKEYENILEGNNQQAPMTIRVNTIKISRDDYQDKLAANNVIAEKHEYAKDALVLQTAKNVNELPGFNEGEFVVQDAAAQLAVDFLNIENGQYVLDGCAAPGGKTTHILQRSPKVNLIAVEKDESRSEKIKENLKRLNLSCELVISDLSNINKWWNNQLFDRILIDVPCSATGVIRRNPDIKLHRKEKDIAALVTLQRELIDACWTMLKSGGIMVYATCSVLKEENERQMKWLSEKYDSIFCEEPIDFTSDIKNRAEAGIQILPNELNMDGFYLCAIKKV